LWSVNRYRDWPTWVFSPSPAKSSTARRDSGRDGTFAFEVMAPNFVHEFQDERWKSG
jgi:hypothetical protein